MKVAIVGYGVEGKSAFAYYHRLHAEITICDQNPDLLLPDYVGKRLGESYLEDLDEFDLIVRSAGIHPQLLLNKNPTIESKITSVINEFMAVCPTKHIIGITGTKGKGTTSTLIAKMLEASGEKVLLGGNIGNSPLDFLDKITEDTWVILELSSFQLIDLKKSPNIAVCLMVVPEHLNWHANLDEYILAKAQLFEHQTLADTAIYNHQNDLSEKIVSYGHGLKIPFMIEPGAHVVDSDIVMAAKTICQTDELKLVGPHNWQNVCAAITTVWQITQNTSAIRSVLTSFEGLEHRLELVREVGGVRYYDDSFGTTPETAIVAIEAFKEPKVIILGGSDKGVDYDQLARAVANDNVRQVILIGETAPAIEDALHNHHFGLITPGGDNMSDIIEAASYASQPGDVVLLSPGCASFGMFDNYKDRGEQFKKAVNNLNLPS